MRVRFEKIACAIVFALAAVFLGFGFIAILFPSGHFYKLGPGVFFPMAGVCLIAGLLDLNFILRGKLSPTQRISRHLWRMCLALLITALSLYPGQAKLFPESMRGSKLLLMPQLMLFAFMVLSLWRVSRSRRNKKQEVIPDAARQVRRVAA